MVQLAQRAQHITESLTLAITAKANALRMEGIDVVSFGAGEPDLPTPARIVGYARDALTEGFTKYTPSAGILPLRQAICRQYETLYHGHYDPSEVIVTGGAKQALYLAFLALCSPGDEVLIPTPYWNSYVDQVQLAGGVPVFVPPTSDLGIDVAQLRARATPKAKLLVINSPSNPSGRVLSDDELAEIAKIARERGLFVISDEIYEHLVYGGKIHRSIVMHHGLRDSGLVISGVSKTLSMTGWRIGYALGPADLIAAMARLQGHMTSCANSIAQHAALGGLSDTLSDYVAPMVAEYDKRRLYMITRLRSMAGITVSEPSGAFYAFPRVARFYGKRAAGGTPIANSFDFARALLDAHNVAVVPGSAFGSDEHIRLSYATSLDDIEKGLDRLEDFLRKIA